jgi:hypothetical protein
MDLISLFRSITTFHKKKKPSQILPKKKFSYKCANIKKRYDFNNIKKDSIWI